ncbi:hypothetical protein ACFVSS_23715 [Peribacillus butanolivorans]|uniref:hypothetical protein n=1 Tax=Peribacillus butanolivorans TaxID=421767 RepID=UPI0036D84B49
MVEEKNDLISGELNTKYPNYSLYQGVTAGQEQIFRQLVRILNKKKESAKRLSSKILRV